MGKITCIITWRSMGGRVCLSVWLIKMYSWRKERTMTSEKRERGFFGSPKIRETNEPKNDEIPQGPRLPFHGCCCFGWWKGFPPVFHIVF